jgi:hypothetical protein
MPSGNPTIGTPSVAETAKKHITVTPDNEDVDFITVIYDIKMFITAVKASDEYNFMLNTVKGLFNVVNAGGIEAIVTNGITCLVQTAQDVEKVISVTSKTYGPAFVIPVHAKKNHKYSMHAYISGSSIVTDINDRDGINPFVTESDETAKITASLRLEDTTRFNKGGTVDTTSTRTKDLLSDKGIEYNIEGRERRYGIDGITYTGCLTSNRTFMSEVIPDILAVTDGSFLPGTPTLCGISIDGLVVVYTETPCTTGVVPGSPGSPGAPGGGKKPGNGGDNNGGKGSKMKEF